MAGAGAFPVAETNIEQAAAWDGAAGAYWAAHAVRFDRALACYDAAFANAASIERDDSVLDVGCGTGQTTRDAALLAKDGSAFGVDLSARMIDLARRLASQRGIENAAFEQADAQIFPFPTASFDVAISRTGTMFFGDPRTAFSNIARAIRPDGRLVMLVWQGPERNEWIRTLSEALAAGRELPRHDIGTRGPFAFAEPERARSVLADAGFTDVDVHSVTGPMWFGAGADDAYEFVLGLMGWILSGLDDAGIERAHDDLRATVAAHASRGGVTFESAAWLVHAVRPQ